MMSEKRFKLLSLLFLILGLTNLIAILLTAPYFTVFWFCSMTVWLFALGLYFRNNFLISSVVTASFIIELIWVIDMASFLLTGDLAFGVAQYLLEASLSRLIITFYHLFLLITPILIVFNMSKFHKYSWAGASAFLFLVSIITLLTTSTNINCVRQTCELGIFNGLKSITEALPFIPTFITHWFFITLIVFMPTHYMFRKIKKWIEK